MMILGNKTRQLKLTILICWLSVCWGSFSRQPFQNSCVLLDPVDGSNYFPNVGKCHDYCLGLNATCLEYGKGDCKCSVDCTVSTEIYASSQSCFYTDIARIGEQSKIVFN